MYMTRHDLLLNTDAKEKWGGGLSDVSLPPLTRVVARLRNPRVPLALGESRLRTS